MNCRSENRVQAVCAQDCCQSDANWKFVLPVTVRTPWILFGTSCGKRRIDTCRPPKGAGPCTCKLASDGLEGGLPRGLGGRGGRTHSEGNTFMPKIAVLATLLICCGASALAQNTMPAPPGGATGPCADDLQKYCKGIQPGGGRLAACLEPHRAQLTQECRSRMEPAFKMRDQAKAKSAPDGNMQRQPAEPKSQR